MNCQIIAVGQKMPKWCVIACEEYAKRLQRFLKCALVEIPTAIRHKSSDVLSCKELEGQKILQKISNQDTVIVLDVIGENWSTPTLAKKLSISRQDAQNLTFVIGGPDGLSSECLARANQRWSLSALTFPHALVRVLLYEQLYRAASLLANHPYHRE